MLPIHRAWGEHRWASWKQKMAGKTKPPWPSDNFCLDRTFSVWFIVDHTNSHSECSQYKHLKPLASLSLWSKLQILNHKAKHEKKRPEPLLWDVHVNQQAAATNANKEQLPLLRSLVWNYTNYQQTVSLTLKCNRACHLSSLHRLSRGVIRSFVSNETKGCWILSFMKDCRNWLNGNYRFLKMTDLLKQ